MSTASHYPTLHIHVEACGTSEMATTKDYLMLENRKNMGHTFVAYTCTGYHWTEHGLRLV